MKYILTDEDKTNINELLTDLNNSLNIPDLNEQKRNAYLQMQQMVYENVETNKKRINWEKQFQNIKPGTLLKVNEYSTSVINITNKYHELATQQNQSVQQWITSQHLEIRHTSGYSNQIMNVYTNGLCNYEGDLIYEKLKRNRKDEQSHNVCVVKPDDILLFIEYLTTPVYNCSKHFYFPGKNPLITQYHIEWCKRVLCYNSATSQYMTLPAIILNIIS